jgi:hypothetical protein
VSSRPPAEVFGPFAHRRICRLRIKADAPCDLLTQSLTDPRWQKCRPLDPLHGCPELSLLDQNQYLQFLSLSFVTLRKPSGFGKKPIYFLEIVLCTYDVIHPQEHLGADEIRRQQRWRPLDSSIQ